MAKASFYEGNETIRFGEGQSIAPREDQVQIAVAYSGICGTDLHVFHGEMDGRVGNSRIIGHEMSGTISAIGAGVTDFDVGDRVTVMPLDPCGKCGACKAGHSHLCYHLNFMGIDSDGAFQSYWTVPANTVLHLPENLSLEHGALIEPLAVACHDVRLGQVVAGDKVVVLGGGPIGLLIAMVARYEGAVVAISEINSFRLDIARDLGFAVVNPFETDAVAWVDKWTEGAGGADVVFEVTAHPSGAQMMTKLARSRGRIVQVGIFGAPAPVDLQQFVWRELRLCGARVYERQDFQRAIDLAASGKLPMEAMVSEVFSLERLKEGMDRLSAGGPTLKILIKCDD